MPYTIFTSLKANTIAFPMHPFMSPLPAIPVLFTRASHLSEAIRGAHGGDISIFSGGTRVGCENAWNELLSPVD